MTVTAAEGLRANLIGAWTLESYESHSPDGPTVIYPLGPMPRELSCTPPTATCQPS